MTMALPTRAQQIVDTLPTLYFQDPVMRRVVDSVAGRLAVAQSDLEEVLHAHWVETADSSPLPVAIERPLDLARIAGLIPVVPFPDEADAARARETVVVDSATVMEGPPGDPLTFDKLVVGQRVVIGGARRPDGAVQAARLLVSRALAQQFDVRLDGLIAEIQAPSAVERAGRLIVLAGRSGAEMFRQRLTLTTQVFLDGVGTAPAILKMTAAALGWGRLIGTIADWSAMWSADEPLFQAHAEGTSAPITLRELPLRAATSPAPHRVKSGARWIETGGSSFIVDPTIEIAALDLPVLVPTIVNLDTQVAIATLVALDTFEVEQGELIRKDVSMRVQGHANGALTATLLERRLPQGDITETDVSDRIRVRSPGLRIDRAGSAALLSGGADGRVASLVVSDGHRAARLAARSDGIWGNAVRVAHASVLTLELRFDPAVALGGLATDATTYIETMTLDELLAGQSRLVTGEDFTFRIPEGKSRWLFFDHAGPAMFDTTQWDLTVFDDPTQNGGDVDEAFGALPAKGVYDYTSFDGTSFPQEFLRAFRFDQETSRFDDALYNETPEQVEVQLGWNEGQRATIRLDVPVQTPAEGARLAALPDMIRRVKPAGVKVILGQPLHDQQPLAELEPRVRPLMSEQVTLGESVRLELSVRLSEGPPPHGESIIGTMNSSEWDQSRFDTRR
jgi:hypothetical protein